MHQRQAEETAPWDSQNDHRAKVDNNQANRKFRPEIQGLRALAVFLVVAYHFWFGRVSGGVDVFLLISAFLMAGSFARKIENRQFKGFRGVWEYWIHVFKRILPLASVTVVGILLGSYLFLPEDRWYSLISEAKSVVFYYENWWSISNLVDYYAADTGAASPFRHFWSLSLQGQIYILWPLIFLVSALIIRVLKLNVRATLTAIFGCVFALSLAYSVYITASDQQVAYYNTFARLWEFALGSLVAFILPWLNINRYVRAVMGWAGIAMIISCGLIFEVEGVFPGYHALWPTLAASMIIVAGDTNTKFGPEKLLTLKPLLTIGGFSYGLYLVHWPLLVFFLYRNQAEKAGIISGIGLLTISIVLAYVITRWVETPLRSWKKLDRSHFGALGVITACLALAVVPAYGWQKQLDYKTQKIEAERNRNNPGAKSLVSGFVYEGDPNPEMYPALADLSEDWANVGVPCGEKDFEIPTEVDVSDYCSLGHVAGEKAETVVAVGNSHMQVWAPALINWAQTNKLNLIFYIAGGCFYSEDDNPDPGCVPYSESAHQVIEDINPEYVVVTGTKGAPDAPDIFTEAMEEDIRSLSSQGRSVIALRDHPRFTTNFSTCYEFGNECAKPAGLQIGENPMEYLQDEIKNFATVDFNDLVCTEAGVCPEQIGNIYTYMDSNHITSSYVESANAQTLERLDQALMKVRGKE